uniref:Uncharacterized protein n=1 Tax=Setaria viridis TaxID=4556 RepID=A0A4V6D9W3_SETVI|nr:hypothetical protein SEVIR_3G266250v2 [Setaria viridis]
MQPMSLGWAPSSLFSFLPSLLPSSLKNHEEVKEGLHCLSGGRGGLQPRPPHHLIRPYLELH